MAVALLIATEKQLGKDQSIARLYDEQMKNMIDRGAARKLTKIEIKQYTGPVHYITHHAVIKPDHPTTPCRIVFNTSKNYHGHILNEYWAIGPYLINNMLGILLRFREDFVCVVGDIRKMYHSVNISEVDQHVHRFLWRNMNRNIPAETYVMNCVSFWDKPAGTIAQLALRKTADMKKDQYPNVWQIIHKNTYVDDILDSVPDVETAVTLSKNIDEALCEGGFKVKYWLIPKNIIDNQLSQLKSGTMNDVSEDVNVKSLFEKSDETLDDQKVLGMKWNPATDANLFLTELKFKQKKIMIESPNQNENHSILLILTKIIILSQINAFFDPLGLASPFTIRAKILMRRLWMHGRLKNLSWDDPMTQWKRGLYG